MPDTPLGFQPRTPAVPPLWLHTIELNSDRSLAGAVVVVRRADFDNMGNLVAFVTGTDDMTCVLHRTEDALWVRLDRNQAIELRSKLGKTTEETSPFGDDAFDAYAAMMMVDSILDGE